MFKDISFGCLWCFTGHQDDLPSHIWSTFSTSANLNTCSETEPNLTTFCLITPVAEHAACHYHVCARRPSFSLVIFLPCQLISLLSYIRKYCIFHQNGMLLCSVHIKEAGCSKVPNMWFGQCTSILSVFALYSSSRPTDFSEYYISSCRIMSWDTLDIRYLIILTKSHIFYVMRKIGYLECKKKSKIDDTKWFE